MPIEDLRALPRFEDGLTFVYVEYVRIEQEDHALVFVDVRGRVPVPVASLAVLLCGPGTTVTHAAVVSCAENGCTLLFCGERGVRLYAAGLGETRSASNLLVQARFWADPLRHQAVVERMYRTRFDEPLPEQLTLQQLRGREGVRVRDTYARESLRTGVPWTGRRYKVEEWERADPINRALSTAHACLYGLCHAAIVSTGFSTALGFVHTGKNLAFVYDVADLYKATVTIPAAFDAVAAGDREPRRRCCDCVSVHPRVRGDRVGFTLLAVVLTGSPPRARGQDLRGGQRRHLRRFTPACAGTGPVQPYTRRRCAVHPRVRGDR